MHRTSSRSIIVDGEQFSQAASFSQQMSNNQCVLQVKATEHHQKFSSGWIGGSMPPSTERISEHGSRRSRMKDLDTKFFAKVAMVDGHERSVNCCVHLTRRMPVCSCSTLYCCTTAPTPQSHLSATTPPLTTPRARLLLCKQRVLLVAQHTCVAACLQSTVQCELISAGPCRTL